MLTDADLGSNLPPRAMRESMQKTARFILKNGPDFEKKLIENDKNALFTFLNPEDIHHKYYQSVLKRQKIELKNKPELSKDPGQKSTPARKQPIDLSFISNLPPMSFRDLQVMKLTAKAVAANGDDYSTGFQKHIEKTGRQTEFAFLRPKHSYYKLYKHYLDWYKGLIDYSGGAGSNLEKKITDALNLTLDGLMTRAYERAAFEKSTKIAKRNKEAEILARQEHYASINWQDFTLVARVNFDAVDEVSELPAPLTLEEVMSRSLATRAKTLELKSVPSAKQPFEFTEEIISSGKADEVHAPNEEMTAGRKAPKGMKIKAAGESRLKRKELSKSTITCPLTGEKIAEDEFDNHLKTILRDPRYQEQQDNYMRKNFTYASNLTTDQVYENIKNLVKKANFSEEEQAVRAKRSKMEREPN